MTDPDVSERTSIDVGFVVERGDRRYTCEGFTSRGKSIWRREGSGTLMKTWWGRVGDLPKRYRVVKRP